VNDIEKAMERVRLQSIAHSKINHDLGDIESRSTNTTKIQPVEFQLKGADAGFRGANRSIRETDESINGVDKDINGAEKDINGADKGINGVVKDINGADKGINGVVEDINGSDKGINGVVKDINDADKGINGVVKDINGADKGINGVGKDVNGASKKISGAGKRLNGAVTGIKGKGAGKGINGADRVLKGADKVIKSVGKVIKGADSGIKSAANGIDDVAKGTEYAHEKRPRKNTEIKRAINDDNHSKLNATKISTDFANTHPTECVLPFEKMQNAGFVTPESKKGKLTEEYRRIKRPLLKNMRGEMITNGLKNVIAVTSSISGEGKTYSAVNLAISMALETERTVLLLDADVVKGAAASLFSISRDQPGLTDVLSDESIEVADVIMTTNVDNLFFMSGGMLKSNTNELLASDVMGNLIVELASRYDDRIIILDCPPILQTNEANILVDYAGQVVFVVAEEETRQKQVLNAIDQIDEEKYVGVLVNKSRSRVGNYDYYGHYG